MFDKFYKEGYSREEQIEALRRSVAAQKDLKRNAGTAGYCFITNGIEVKKVDPDLPIPEGWRRGFPARRGIKNEQQD